VPIIANRIRNGAVRRAAKVAFVNPMPIDVLFPVEASFTSNGLGMAQHLAALLVAALRAAGRPAPAALAASLQGVVPGDDHVHVAALLAQGELRAILLGGLAERHVAYSEIRALSAALAEATGATLGYLPDGANAVGASLAGAVPHRGVGGRPVARPGLSSAEMIGARLRGYVLLGGVERDDLAPGKVDAALQGARCVVALTPYASEEQRANSSVILPVAAFAETSGTWVNVEGRWQSVPGAARAPGEARPAWKVLRVLGNLLGLAGFEYLSSEEIRDELRRGLDEVPEATVASTFATGPLASLDATRSVGLYAVDAVVRRSMPLQQTRDGKADARGGAA